MKSIIFDVGGVIALHNYAKVRAYLKSKYKLSSEFRDVYRKLVIQRDLGKINEHQFVKLLSKKLKVKIDEESFYHTEFNYTMRANKALLRFIKTKLYKQFPLFVFSNNSAVNIRNYDKRICYKKYFQKCIYSFKLGLRKPNKNFFIKALKLIHKNGKDCIFIDDQLKSKSAAKSLGITFIQYKNLSQLKNELRKLGII
jgi:putative hydrolase of the HAD superfamily